jgi:hypothetical protein
MMYHVCVRVHCAFRIFHGKVCVEILEIRLGNHARSLRWQYSINVLIDSINVLIVLRASHAVST